MDTYRCIVTKRDWRSFARRPLPAQVLRQILNAGRMSGSSRNRQPWRFIVTTEPTRLAALARFGRFAQHVATAAAAVTIVIDEPGQAFDAGRCAQNMMLAAWNAGVASCPATMHDGAGAKRFLEVPADKHIAIVLSFGYPRPRRGPIERAALRILAGRGRKPLAAITAREGYRAVGNRGAGL